MRHHSLRQTGQAIIMVTLALMAMFGLVGMAIDMGWSMFTRRSAQSAADSAAFAAAIYAINNMVSTNGWACDNGTGNTGLYCTTSAQGTTVQMPCHQAPYNTNPAVHNLALACSYAARHGFNSSANFGSGARQLVTVEAAVPVYNACTAGAPGAPPTCVPTAPGVGARYYVTVRIWEKIPQLFSAVLGNTEGEVSVRATGALADSEVRGSLLLLNRENDISPGDGLTGQSRLPTGMNLKGGGGTTTTVPGGIVLSSNCDGSNCGGNNSPYAGEVSGNSSVSSPFTYIRDVGDACAGNLGCSGVGQSVWSNPPGNSTMPNWFLDPMRNKIQPPLPEDGNPNFAWNNNLAGMSTWHPVVGGNLVQYMNNNGWANLPPGVYYSVNAGGAPTGAPLTISGNVNFGTCGSNLASNNFVFFGGLHSPAAQGKKTLRFAQGRYVFAGALNGLNVMDIGNGNDMIDCVPGANNSPDTGLMFMFTDGNGYSASNDDAGATWLVNGKPPGWDAFAATNLGYGGVSIKMGNCQNCQLDLSGLDNTGGYLANYNYQDWNQVLFWWDRWNSNVRYTANGHYDTSCSGTLSPNDPCLNYNRAGDNNQPDRILSLEANANTDLTGVIYQPRGTAFYLSGAPQDAGPLMVVSGALHIWGGSVLTLTGPPTPLTITVAALVE